MIEYIVPVDSDRIGCNADAEGPALVFHKRTKTPDEEIVRFSEWMVFIKFIQNRKVKYFKNMAKKWKVDEMYRQTRSSLVSDGHVYSAGLAGGSKKRAFDVGNQ